jgi:hypothetical protein
MECTRLVAAAVVVGGTIGTDQTSTDPSAPGGLLVTDLLGGDQAAAAVDGPVPDDPAGLIAAANRAW